MGGARTAGWQPAGEAGGEPSAVALLRELSGLPVQVVMRDEWERCDGSRQHGFCKALQGFGPTGCGQHHAALRRRAVRRRAPVCDVCPYQFAHWVAPVVVKRRVVAVLEVGWGLVGEPAEDLVPGMLARVDGRLPAERRAVLVRAFMGSRTLASGRLAELRGVVEVVAGQLAREWGLAEAGESPPMVLEAKKHVERAFRESLTVTGMAAKVGVSPDHFSRVFRRAVGCGFLEYVMRVRVSVAADLLAATDLSIGEIAYASGFTAVPHFNRAFRRVRGVTPGAHRRAARAGGNGSGAA